MCTWLVLCATYTHAAAISVGTIDGINTVDAVIGSSIDATCTPPGVSATAPCYYNNVYLNTLDETITEAELANNMTYVDIVNPVAGMESYVFSTGDAYIDLAFTGVNIYNGAGNDLVFFFVGSGYSFQLDLLDGNGAQAYSVTAGDTVFDSGGGTFTIDGYGVLTAVFVDLDDFGLALGDQLGTFRITTGGSLGLTILSSVGGFYTEAPPPLLPTVTSISPNTDDTRGGIAVTIIGSNYVSGTTAAINGTILTGISVDNSTTITATIPPLPEGVHDLVITTPSAQTVTLSNAFTVTPSPEFKAGDLAPRGAADNQLNAGDLVVLQRIVMGEITPTVKETLIGDVSPLSLPDGQLNASDVLMLQRAILEDVVLGNVVDSKGPQINITSPADNSYTSELTSTINGALDEPGTLTINGVPVPVDGFLAFTQNINLIEGANAVSLIATDIYGNTDSLTLTINRDTVAPASVDGSKLVISGSGAQTTVSGSVGSVEAGATVSILANGKITTIIADANGAFSAIINASESDLVQITVIDQASNNSDALIYTVGALQITSPPAAATINAETANIVGLFANENNSGISVNGETACTYNNNFYLNNLPLATGANTITATYTTESGGTQTAFINVTQSGTSDYEFNASQDCGVAPLNVTFDLDAGSNTLQQLDIDYDNDGTIDLSTTTPATETLQYNYTTPGVYAATVWVTSGGATQQLTLNIVVQDVQQQDDIFQAVWNGMWSALLAGDKVAAMSYLTSEGGRAYGGMFDSLMPNMAEIYGEMSVVEPAEMGSDTTSYAVIRLEGSVVKAYMINYSRGNDGVWRIHSM